MFKRNILYIILLTSVTSSFAQETFKGFSVNLFPGFLIAHRDYMANMEAHTMGFELNYVSNHTGWNSIDQKYKHLRWGFGASYFNLGNRETNGSVIDASLHVEANLKKRAKFQSSLRFGSGIGFLTKPYNFDLNRKNKAIGSRLNGKMQIIYNTYHTISPKHQLVLGIGVTHYSNGNFKRPNLGINMAHLSVGLIQHLNTPEFKSKDLPILFPKNGLEVMFAYANKQIAVADIRRFNIYAASFLAYYQHKNKPRAWRFGPEFFIDNTYPYEKFNPNSLKNKQLHEITEVAFKVGHEFQFGRIAVVTDLGTYLYRPNDYKKRVYFAIGFNYHFNKGIFVQSRLKSHMAVADYFYWGAGYRFKNPLIKND